MIIISPFPLIQERTNERGGWYVGTYMVSHFGDDADANADEEEEDDVQNANAAAATTTAAAA